jgi:hypothetical protein
MMYTLLGQRKETGKALEYWNRYREHERELSDHSRNRMAERAPKMGAKRGTVGIGVRR